MPLLLVESPTKSKTLKKILGKNYQVMATMGHIRDLPKSELGVDIEKDFQPKYIVIPKARKTVQSLKKEVEKAKLVILSTDPDREGEAIAYHLAYLLNLNGKKPYQRIVFHEITKPAIEQALKNPRKIDVNLVDAQQARRILDRLVGYKLSPFLWKKVIKGLSAGRVQSVAVRLIVEREREIENFITQEYWTVEAILKKQKSKAEFRALLIKKDNKTIGKLEIKTKKEAEQILKDLNESEYKVADIDKKEARKNPLPPFTTSSLQQEAWKKFRWPAKMTMLFAQQLYEQGLITYHRSDSLNISNLATAAAEKFIVKNYGENYHQFRKFKTSSKVAQEAHEAIRPTLPDKTPEKAKTQNKLNDKQYRLYEIIWQRFLASQMAQAVFDSTTVDIQAKNYLFRSTGQILKFDGFLKVYPIKYEEAELPPLEKNEILELISLLPSQHFTQPPARYTEASLIKTLEKYGIGRPSTYAPIISTIQERNYVEKNEKRYFKPTEIGVLVNDILVSHFPEIVDVKFTANMEENLDKIAQGKEKLTPVIKEFYGPFAQNLEKKYEEVSKKALTQETDKICPECGAKLLIRLGKYGKFYACSKFPQCKYTESLEKNTLGIKCPKCKKGEIVEKRTKTKKIFYGCNQFPNCDFALWDKPVNEYCPNCQSILVETKRKQIRCSNKECDYKKTELIVD